MITCIGEILIDQFIDGKEVLNAVGGAPFNVCVAIKRSGGHSSFVGSVGDDELGELIFRFANRMGLDNIYLHKYKEYKTTIAQVKLVNGERSFTFIRDEGADYHYSLPLPEFVYKSNIVHFGSLMLSEDIGRTFIKQMIKELKRRGILISFDINYRDDIFDDVDDVKNIYKEVIDEVDILKISDEEVDIFGRDYIYSLKDKLICTSLGSKGSEYQYNFLKGFVPSYKVKPVDTTGAGDAFFGAVLSYLDGHKLNELKKEYLDEVFKFANAVGGLTTLGKGAIDPIPDKETVKKYLLSK